MNRDMLLGAAAALLRSVRDNLKTDSALYGAIMTWLEEFDKLMDGMNK